MSKANVMGAFERAMVVLKAGASALSGIVEQAVKDCRSVTEGMVAVWKPVLKYTPAGKVDETTPEFKAMRKAFKEAVQEAQKTNANFKVEFRKVDHGSGVKVWTDRSTIALPKDPAERAKVNASIDKLDVFVWMPGMRDHDMKKVDAELKAQVYRPQIARLDNNGRQSFNNFKIALNASAVRSANAKAWDESEWKRIESHFNKRNKDGFTEATIGDVRAAYDALLETLGYGA